MNKQFAIRALCFAGIFATASAHATTFSGNAIGSWLNVDSSDPSDVYSVTNSDAGATAVFDWGVGVPGSFSSQFVFDGVGSDGAPLWTTSDETAFKVGDFSYRNGATYYSFGITGVDLGLAVTMVAPLGMAQNYTFDFHITNTPNNTGNPVLDGDIVTVTSAFSPTTFNYLGATYTLALLGFSTDSGATITSNFSSPEGANASAGVYAKITSQIPSVPEPGMLGLLSVGCLAMRRFISRKA